MRIQFYPSPELENSLIDEARELGVNVSTLVNDLLNKHYGLIPATDLSNSELRKIIFQEIGEYVKSQETGEEFDLNNASETYKHIDMVYSGKPSVIKAQIGKEFNSKYVGRIEPFSHIEQVFLANGKPKKTVSNRAAVYAIREGLQENVQTHS